MCSILIYSFFTIKECHMEMFMKQYVYLYQNKMLFLSQCCIKVVYSSCLVLNDE